MAAESHTDVLLNVLQRGPRHQSVTWLRGALPRSDAPFDRDRFFAAYAGAGRRFRAPQWHPAEADEPQLREIGVVVARSWASDELARASLLLAAAASAPASEHQGLVEEVFRKGDNAERSALLKSLALLPDPARFLKTATEASRTHVQEVFEAIACENPYPARYFPELNFNQLVLKALFLEVPVSRMHDWRSRCNAELGRMVADYEAERRAAGRSVPQDIAMIQQQVAGG